MVNEQRKSKVINPPRLLGCITFSPTYRAYGNENWEFAENGLMQKRYASINDIQIQESERKFRWER